MIAPRLRRTSDRGVAVPGSAGYPLDDGILSRAIDSAPAIVARGVSKTFRVPEERMHTLKERALHPRRRIRYQTFQALNDISFAVERGEFFGIAGRNGSGKSTLLKCIAGIYRAEGDIWCRGRLSTFIELGVGFNPDLAARDNVVINGIMMGLSPREARRRYESVIEFAELEEFQDSSSRTTPPACTSDWRSRSRSRSTPTSCWSTRCSPSATPPSSRSASTCSTMRDEGKTIVFVTHDMGSMQRFCHRAMLLERGEVHLGEPQEVADRYLEINFGRDPPDAESSRGRARRWRGAGGRRSGWRTRAASGSSRSPHEPVTLKARVSFMVDVVDPSASVYIHNEEHKAVVVATTWIATSAPASSPPARRPCSHSRSTTSSPPGRYSPVIKLAHRGAGLDVIDRFESGFSFVVTGPRRSAGWSTSRSGQPSARADADGSSSGLGMSVQAPSITRRSGRRSGAPARSPTTGGASGT